jgi:predicted small lipoprotein YifL
MKARSRTMWMLLLSGIVSLGLMACEKKGPLEQAGEEVDEAVDTLKNGGEESTATKVDDAIDEAREGAQDTADELKKD